MATSNIKNLEAVLKKFTLQELCDVAVQEFPETTWDKIRNFIIVHSATLNNKNVIKILLNIAKEDLTKEQIENRISNLLLFAVGKSLKKTWISFQLKNNITAVKTDMLENIKSSIRRTGMLANIHMIKYNNKYVLSIEKKVITKKRGLKKQIPIYYQFFLNEPYLFATRKKIENNIMTAIVESLGYSNWIFCNLSGPNISDLLTLLKNKKTGINSASLLFSAPEPTPIIKMSETVTDFCQKEEREKYAKHIFGDKPPQLHTLSVSLKDVKWQQINDFDQMNDASLDGVKVTFQAENIAELFRTMIKAGIVSEPIPEYMKGFLYVGKNELKITQNK